MIIMMAWKSSFHRYGRVISTMRDGTAYHVIVINKDEHPLQQRYTIGHELAHIGLDHWQLPEAENKEEYDRREHEANRHAWEYYRRFRSGEYDGSIYRVTFKDDGKTITGMVPMTMKKEA